MDFYEEAARKLIGMEVELSKRAKNLPDGYTTGKGRIKRLVLKNSFNISSDFELANLRDALSGLGYALITFDYASDFFLINIKNFLVNTRIIGDNEIAELSGIALNSAETFLNARENLANNKENK